MEYITESLQTPVVDSYDVVIAGGGTAGVVAAIASGRTGARTLLIDRYGFLGGSLINGAGPLHSFFNCYKAFNVPKVQTVRGIPNEIVERMTAANGCLGHLEQELGANYDSVATIIDWELFKNISFQLVKEAGVDVLLHTWVTDTIAENNKIKGLILENKSGRSAVLAKCVVDTTGDADVCYHAGAQCSLKPLDQNAHIGVGMPFGMTNVDMDKLCAYLEQEGLIYNIIHCDNRVVRLGFYLKNIPPFTEYMNARRMWGPLCVSRKKNELSFINMANVDVANPLDAKELSEAEMTLRRQITEISQMMIALLPGCEDAYVNWTPIQAGVRRTRIVDCEYDITMDDITSAKKFEDDIAVYGFHDLAPKYFIKNGGYYGIPYRALLPKGIEGLLVAGRSITLDWKAHMSTRNTVSCMAQGQAVGTAAAMSTIKHILPRQIDIHQLQQQLLNDGVFLG